MPAFSTVTLARLVVENPNPPAVMDALRYVTLAPGEFTPKPVQVRAVPSRTIDPPVPALTQFRVGLVEVVVIEPPVMLNVTVLKSETPTPDCELITEGL